MRKLLWIVALAAACGRGEKPRTDTPAPEPFANKGATVEVVKTAGYIGVVTAREAVEITAPFTTNVDKFLVTLGDKVKIGDKLANLDEAPLLEQLAIAKAEMRASQADVAKSGVAAASAIATLNRERAGAKAGITSKAELSDAQFKSSGAGADVARAVATVEQMKAKISAMEVKLKGLTITSPIAGQVSFRYVEPGARVEEGRPVIKVISSDELFVKFAIPNDQVGKIQPGDKIEVAIEARGVKAKAVVKSVAPELDPIAQMIFAEAELVSPVEKLQSGMVCRVQLAEVAKPTPKAM